jgi:polyhydroxyalkanoate synthase subunit PhaC
MATKFPGGMSSGGADGADEGGAHEAGADEAAAPLDALLTQAALGPFRRFFPGRSALRFARTLASDPKNLTGWAASLAAELARVASGTSSLAPSSRDRRFTDPAWTSNPLLRRSVQAYLATGSAVHDLVRSAPLEWRDAERVKFAADNLVAALAPSNNALLSPVAWKAAIDSGGGSVVTGARQLARDLASSPRVPTMVPPDAYTVGGDLAMSPGSVVLRTPVFELIQYRPATEAVRALPLLIVPPTINKYYILDLAPGRSLIEYLVAEGQQVFVLSWRNPDERHAAWGFDAYVHAIIDAVDAVADICGATAVHLAAACSGGILAALAVTVLSGTALSAPPPAAAGQHARVASLGLLVTMLDQSRAGPAGALVDETTAEAAIAASARKGYLDGRTLAEVFAWLRPGDLIWNYWVNNYLQGRPPPAFDILYWNADTTRMTAALHRDFVRAAMGNSLARPGGVTVLGTEADLGQLDTDCYAVAGVADHICPWQSCYRSSQLLGGKTRFVLSSSGHIAALVNPAGNQKASYQVSDDNTADPVDWQRTAPIQQGSWWPDYAGWLAARSGAEVPAPASPGNARYRVLEEAPGSYVLAS